MIHEHDERYYSGLAGEPHARGQREPIIKRAQEDEEQEPTEYGEPETLVGRKRLPDSDTQAYGEPTDHRYRELMPLASARDVHQPQRRRRGAECKHEHHRSE